MAWAFAPLRVSDFDSHDSILAIVVFGLVVGIMALNITMWCAMFASDIKCGSFLYLFGVTTMGVYITFVAQFCCLGLPRHSYTVPRWLRDAATPEEPAAVLPNIPDARRQHSTEAGESEDRREGVRTSHKAEMVPITLEQSCVTARCEF